MGQDPQAVQSQAQDPGLLTPTLTPSDPGQGPLRRGLALPSSRVSGCGQGQLHAVMKKASQPETDPGHTLSLRRLGSAGVCTLEARGTCRDPPVGSLSTSKPLADC